MKSEADKQNYDILMGTGIRHKPDYSRAQIDGNVRHLTLEETTVLTDAEDKAALNRLLQDKMAAVEDDMAKQWMGAIEMANPAKEGRLYGTNKMFFDPNAKQVNMARSAQEWDAIPEGLIDPDDLGPKGATGMPDPAGMQKAPPIRLSIQQARNGGWAVFSGYEYDNLLGVFHSMEALCIWLKANAK